MGRWIIKIHAFYSNELWSIIKKHKIKPLVLHRNSRDVINSMIHYVSITKFHPEYKKTKMMTCDEKKQYFERKYLNDFEN